VPLEAYGDKILGGLKVEDTKTKEKKDVPCGGLFYAIGHQPNTTFLNGQIECDEVGYIKTIPGACGTNVKGVFACGDVQDKKYRQAISAAGSGCMAALEVEKFLQ
jgi:thioredoxin reductase (NADPH)